MVVSRCRCIIGPPSGICPRDPFFVGCRSSSTLGGDIAISTLLAHLKGGTPDGGTGPIRLRYSIALYANNDAYSLYLYYSNTTCSAPGPRPVCVTRSTSPPLDKFPLRVCLCFFGIINCL